MQIMANTVTGRNFETAFTVPASSVVGSEANVHGVVSEQFRIPEDQDLMLQPRVADGRYVGYLGQLTFVDWEADTPSAQVAPVQVDIYAPGFLANAWAKVRGREANATVNVTVLKAKPLGGGDLTNAPDNNPHELGSSRQLELV